LFQQYDKCFLGSAESGDDTRVFCGQLAASYVFSEALNPAQVYAMYQLGPSYKVSDLILIAFNVTISTRDLCYYQIQRCNKTRLMLNSSCCRWY